MKSFTLWVFSLMCSITSNILQAHVFTVFWGWFVLSQFPQLPHLSIFPAIGILFVVALATLKRANPGEINSYKVLDKDEKKWFGIIQSFGVMLITLLFWFDGWLVHLFM